MNIIVCLGLMAFGAFGNIQIYSPPANNVPKGTTIHLAWSTGFLNGSAYTCPNSATDPTSQYNVFHSQCDVAGQSQIDATNLYRTIFSWVQSKANQYEAPLLIVQSWYKNVLFPKQANFSNFERLNITDFPLVQGGLPLHIPDLIDFTFYLPKVGVNGSYSYAQLQQDIFGTANCRPWAISNANFYLFQFLTYLNFLNNGNSADVDTLRTVMVPIYQTNYQNISAYYQNVMQPNAAAFARQGVNVNTFPLPTMPTVTLSDQPTVVSYSLGGCQAPDPADPSDTTPSSVDPSLDPVSIYVYSGVDQLNPTGVVYNITRGLVNNGYYDFQIPCAVHTNSLSESIYIKVATATQAGYLRITTQDCSASTLSLSMFALVMMIITLWNAL